MKHLKQFEEYDNKKPFENDLINAVSNNNFEDVKKLVDNVDDINYQKQGDDMTSLIFAAYRQNYKIMDYLINAGADWNIKDITGEDFFDMMNAFGKKKYLANKYPEKYKEYLTKKQAEKFNI